jgi:methionyl-tRNA formyltransferase
VSELRALRVVFLGNDPWSVPSLEALGRSRHDVVTVATRVPRPGRRGQGPAPTPVAAAARTLGLPFVEVETVKSGPGYEALARAEADVLAVVAYGEILPAAILNIPTIAPVNVHFSLLPMLRGASPVQTALLLGMDQTGVTTIRMDTGLDTGPILRHRAEPIREDDDSGSLGVRLAGIGADLLVETLDDLSAGRTTPVPQDDSLATYAPKLGPADRRLVWRESARKLVNRVRAFAPDPGAAATFRGRPLKVLRAQAVEGTGRPGAVIDVDENGFVVATAEGGFRPLEVAPAGGRRMSAADFARGHHPVRGERLD